MNFNIITSICRNRGIGRSGYIPWNLSHMYLNMFSELTRGDGNNAVLMGSNTYDTIQVTRCKPLSGRDNLILSRENIDSFFSPYGNVTYFSCINSVLSHCEHNKYNEVWIIGGEKVYSELIKQNIPIKNIVFHYIDKDYNCDSFFPSIFNESDRFEMIDRRIVDNNIELLLKVNYNRIPINLITDK